MPVREKKLILWFDEVGSQDVSTVGGKGANLGELLRAGVPVPPGFIVSVQSYEEFLERSGVKEQIGGLLRHTDPSDSNKLQRTADRAKDLITHAPMPADIAREIRASYRKMGQGPVAVRSSATAEDMPEASFAGQQRTFLNIEGEDQVVAAVQGCWASLFEPRAIFYRHQHGIDHMKVGIAVPVQRMVQSDASGVMFTVEPLSSDTSKVVIEAILGLGEAIVSGEVTPDLYVVEKKSGQILEKKVARQDWALVRSPEASNNEDTNIKRALSGEAKYGQKIEDADILALAELGKRIEDYYAFPQDIEWAKENGQLYIVQARPVTTLSKPKEVSKDRAEVKDRPILAGSGAGPGVGIGPVKVIHSALEIHKVQKGDVLVTEMTTPDYVPAMKRAAAIVTDRGGRTCHAAIVSRELGIPCVVGTDQATSLLRTGQMITVDGSHGKVYDGMVEALKTVTVEGPKTRRQTATRVYVNLAEPDLADVIAQRDVDGVGLLRAEFIIAHHVGEHPRYMMEQERGDIFVQKLAQGLETFAKAFHPRPVVYRTTDFKTNEYRNLKGGSLYEDEEENPMLGYRGCFRNISDQEVFNLEIEAIKLARQNYSNLWVMIPFVRTVDELAECKRIMEEWGLQRSDTFKLWMMAEVPSNVILLDKFIDVGIDGISIGSNDLTQLILGADRDNARFSEVFDERNDAVMWALQRLITIARERGITSSICGQAPSFYPDLTARLVEWGITSVSVSPDMIDRTREIIADCELRLGKLPHPAP